MAEPSGPLKEMPAADAAPEPQGAAAELMLPPELLMRSDRVPLMRAKLSPIWRLSWRAGDERRLQVRV